MGAGVQGAKVKSGHRFSRCGFAAPSLLITLAAVLGSCSDSQDDSGSYSIDAQTGQLSAEMGIDDGMAELYSGTVLQDHLPDGFTMFPDAELLSNTIFERGDSNACFLSLQSDASPAQLAAHYRREAEAVGLNVTLSMSLPDSEMLVAEDGQGRRFSFEASRGQEDAEEEAPSDDEGLDSEEEESSDKEMTRVSITISENF